MRKLKEIIKKWWQNDFETISVPKVKEVNQSSAKIKADELFAFLDQIYDDFQDYLQTKKVERNVLEAFGKLKEQGIENETETIYPAVNPLLISVDRVKEMLSSVSGSCEGRAYVQVELNKCNYIREMNLIVLLFGSFGYTIKNPVNA